MQNIFHPKSHSDCIHYDESEQSLNINQHKQQNSLLSLEGNSARCHGTIDGVE